MICFGSAKLYIRIKANQNNKNVPYKYIVQYLQSVSIIKTYYNIRVYYTIYIYIYIYRTIYACIQAKTTSIRYHK